MGGASLRGNRVEFFSHGRNDLLIDGRQQDTAIGFGSAPPQKMDATCADQDRREDEARNCEAYSDSHDRLNLRDARETS
jgi:hypothetical protein